MVVAPIAVSTDADDDGGMVRILMAAAELAMGVCLAVGVPLARAAGLGRRVSAGGIVAAVVVFLLGGCIYFTPLPQDNTNNINANDNGSIADNDNAPIPDHDNVETLSLRVAPTNATPVVGEEVSFACVLQGGVAAGADYSFASGVDRLLAEPGSAIATFIVEESDVGTQITVTCFAELPSGVMLVSPEISIFPTP